MIEAICSAIVPLSINVVLNSILSFFVEVLIISGLGNSKSVVISGGACFLGETLSYPESKGSFT